MNSGMKPHFMQADDQSRIAIDFDNNADFARGKKFEWQYL